MADTRGTWSLSEAWAEKASAEWVPIPNVWLGGIAEDQDTSNGFWIGGDGRSNMDKIAFASDTISTPSNLRFSGFSPSPGGVRDLGVCANGTYGYNGGGRLPGAFWKHNFGGDSLAVVPSLATVSGTMAAGTETKGWWFGTTAPSGTYEVNYLTEAFQQLPSAGFPDNNNPYRLGSFSQTVQNQVYAGLTPSGPSGSNNRVKKLTFATTTFSNSGWNLYASGYMHGAMDANPSNDGYVCGFYSPSSPYLSSSTSKISLSSSSASRVPGANLPSARYKAAGFGSPSAGYIGGGGGATTNTCKMPWASQTFSSLPATLSAARGYHRGYSGSSHGITSGFTSAKERWFDSTPEAPDVGYVTMGQGSPGGALRSSTEKLDMTTDTSMSQLPGGNVPFPGMQGGCSFGNYTDGITATGGNQPDMSTDYTYVNKFTYSTETFSSLSGYPGSQTAEGRGYAAGATGYYVGGFVNMSAPADLSSVNKFAFATDTWSESPSPLNDARYWFSNIQNNTEGWVLGGYHPSKSSSEKLTFSTDTWSSESSTLPSDAKRYYIGGNGSGDATAGYWAGGHPSPGSNKVWKLVYATGTVSNEFDLTPSSPADSWTLNTGMANETKGYFAGGLWGLGQTEVCKFPYATETASNINPGMNQNRQGAFSFGPRKLGSRLNPPTATPTSPTSLTGPEGIKNEGYLIQGIQGATSGSGRSDVYRLDYSTETWNSSVFANSTLTRKNGGAASTTTAAYIGGGGLGAADGNPTGGDMDKLTYATSTMSRIPGSDAGRISDKNTDAQPAAGNQTLGYWGGGYGAPGAGRSHIDKFVYSSETGASLPNWPWSQGNLGVAVSIQTHAYLGGGPSSTGANFVKITFANDTYASKNGWTTSSSEKKYSGATSSPSKAYIVGGSGLERRVDITTWASDTTSNSPSTFLASPGFSYAPGQGSNEAGYFTGGGNTGNNGTTTEKITFASDTSAILPGAYFTSTSPSGINSYTTGGPNMNGVGTSSPNVI